MTPEALLAGTCAAGVAVGIVGLAAGIRGHVPTARPSRWRRRSPRTLTGRQRRVQRIRWGASASVGVVVWLVSGWVLAVPLVMLAVLGWPWLMAPARADHSKIERLEALAEWTTRVAARLEFGAGLENAIIRSREGCPKPIESEVDDLVSRLQAHAPATEALRMFAAAFADATADKIAAALILRADSSGPGLADALKKFASSVRDEVRQRRRIEADRASARLAVRWITYLILALGVGMAFNRDYSSPYASVLGQLVLAALSACFIGVLLWMRSITAYKAAPRFLAPDKRSAVKLPTPDAAPDTTAVPAGRTS